MQTIFTDKSRCRKSYACFRVCPVNAIRVQDDGTVIFKERCILCGNCIDACSQRAILMTDTLPVMEKCLTSSAPVNLLLDPDWPLTMPNVSPPDLESALKRKGFTGVLSSFLAIEYVFEAYENVMKDRDKPLIGSLCQIVSTYVEKHAPSLIPHMIPVVTPAVATARYVRSVNPEPVNIVLATSCLATKAVPEIPGM